MNWTLAALLVVVAIAQIDALSCFCGFSPCEVPKCCPSGRLTTDACGCCPACAKGELETCGGPWNTAGDCVQELNCLRKCECKAVSNVTNEERACIFPFKFQGVEYTQCTTDHSDNGKPWCALEVDANGVVVVNQWADCNYDCPGADFPCNEDALFNFEGACVKRSEAEDKLKDSPLSYKFDENYPSSEKPIEQCLARDGSDTVECRCAPKSANPSRGEGCQPDFGSEGSGDGWCFLEHVLDHENPSYLCFSDATWSPSHGRFYSNEACSQSKLNIPDPPILLEEPEIPQPPPTFSDAGPPAPPPPGTKLVFPPGSK